MAFVVAALWEYIANLRAQRDAERLLQQVRTLNLDESAAADVERIVGQFGAIDMPFPGYCESVDWVRSIEVSSPSLNRIGRKIPWLRWFGNPAWDAQAHFAISQGRLCFVEYSISANPSPPLLGTFFVLNSRADYHRPFLQTPEFSYGVGLRNLHYFHDLSASVTTLGGPKDHQRAFDFDLSCLSRLGGCRGVCELMPSAWIDYQKKAQEKGLDLPADELADPYCQKP
ncbi:MAG: hypothetical protein WAL74_09245 [Candidatus Acidiferrales bacterium]